MVKEMNDTKLRALKDLVFERIDGLRSLFTERSERTELALKLQAREYEKRLSDLNNENARILQAQQQSVNKMVYNIQYDNLLKRVHELELSKSNIDGKASMSALITTIVIAVSGLAIGLMGLLLK